MINYLRYRHYENTLFNELTIEKQKTDSLRLLLNKLQNDSLYIESIARTRLGMVKPNEKMIIFRNEMPDSVSNDSTNVEDTLVGSVH